MRMFHNPKFQVENGFTLIEILTVVAIMTLVFAGGMASYNSFNSKRKIEAMAKNFESVLITARNRAQAGSLPDGCGQLDAYRVMSTGENCFADYCLMAVCSSGTIKISDYFFNGGVVVYYNNAIISINPIVIDFNVISGEVNGSGNIIFLGGVNRYLISVLSGGAIVDGGWQE